VDVHAPGAIVYARTMNVLAIAGSLRRGSFNRLLLEAAARCAPPGMTVRVYEPLGAIPLFNEDLERAPGGPPAPVSDLRRAVRESDGLLIATPEYNQSIPGVLKNLIDWLSRPSPDRLLARKPAAVIGVTSGRWGTRLAQSTLRHVLLATEAYVLPAPSLFAGDADRLFDADGRLVDVPTEKALRNVLAAFAAWIPLVADASDAARSGVMVS
jgi:chromate reductase